MSKDRTKLDKAGESAGINVSMLKTVPIVPVNSVQSLSGRNSVRMESLNSTSKNLLEKSNQIYDKIKTTERSRVKTDVIAQNEYFQVRKKIDIK
jgi:molybdenum cofactor biosynthesis enzyme